MSTAEAPTSCAGGERIGQPSVQFHADDSFLIDDISRLIATALIFGDSAVLITTGSRRRQLQQTLQAHGVETLPPAEQGRYVVFDADDMLSDICDGASLDEKRFTDFIQKTVEQAASNAQSAPPRVVVFSELVALLINRGFWETAHRLEQLWHDQVRRHSFSLHCAYPVNAVPRKAVPNNESTEELWRLYTAKHAVKSEPSGSYQKASMPAPRHINTGSDEVSEVAAMHQEGLRLLTDVVQDYAIFMLDPEGCVVSWNAGAERIKGYKASEIIGQHFSRFYPPEDIRARKPQRELEIATQQGRIEDEGWRLRKDGSRFWANVIITAVRNANGTLLGFAKITRDVTERMHAAQKLRESEARYRTVAETATDAILSIDETSVIRFANPATTKIFGFENEELLGHPITVLMPEPIRERHLRGLQRYLQTGKARLDWTGVELIAQRKNGKKFPVEVSFGEVTSGNERLFIGFIRDITQRKLAEQKMRVSEKSLRELSLHLLHTQDEERRRLGRELHDSLGQYLAALKMRLDTMASTMGPREPALREQIGQCARLTQDSIKEIRTISYLMYPPMLEEMGLRSAIPWYLEGFTQRSGIRTALDMPADFERLPRDVELALFRVLQEALTNVHRHSGSPDAKVSLSLSQNIAVLEVRDSGKGMPTASPDAALQDAIDFLGVGLRGMSERMRQLDGKLEISSTPHGGTTITATIPCSKATGDSAAA